MFVLIGLGWQVWFGLVDFKFSTLSLVSELVADKDERSWVIKYVAWLIKRTKKHIAPHWRVATYIHSCVTGWLTLTQLLWVSYSRGKNNRENSGANQSKGAQKRKLKNEWKLLIVVKIVISSQPFEISAILIFSQDTLGNNDSLTLVAMIWQDYWKESQEIFE